MRMNLLFVLKARYIFAIAIALLQIFVYGLQYAHAGNTVSVTRGHQPVYVGWTVYGGHGGTFCAPSTSAEAPYSQAEPAGIRNAWMTAGPGSRFYGYVSLPKPTVVGSFYFRCTHASGVFDQARLNVNDCTLPQTWNGGSEACEAPAPIIGVCGPAANVSYPNTATGYAGAYCNAGTPSDSPAFPPTGGSASWTCLGVNGGLDSVLCTAAVANLDCSGNTIISNCSLPVTVHGGSAGSCATNYSGLCNYSCSNGVWTSVTNSCTPNAPTVDISASDLNPVYNGSTDLTWITGGLITQCDADNDWSGQKNIAGGLETASGITTSKRYSISCTGPGGTSPLDFVDVVPQAQPFPNLDPSFPTPPGPYVKDKSIQLSGTVQNTGSLSTGIGFDNEFSYKWGAGGSWVVIDTPSHGALNSGGTVSDGPTNLFLNQTGQLYLQYCADSGLDIDEGVAGEVGNCIQLAPIDVVEMTGTIDGTTPVNINDTSTITWNTQNTSGSCDIDGDNGDLWTGQALSNAVGLTTQPLTVDTTYTLECDGVLLDFVTITVNEVDITATPRLVNVGTQITIDYDTSGQNNCTITGGGNTYTVSNSGSIPNITINAQTTFVLDCPVGIDDRTTVDVVPVGFET